MKNKPLLIMNGRWKDNKHIYIAGKNKTDCARILAELSGHKDVIQLDVNRCVREINTYFSIGCWGNPMDGIKVERGAWVQKSFTNDKPERVL